MSSATTTGNPTPAQRMKRAFLFALRKLIHAIEIQPPNDCEAALHVDQTMKELEPFMTREEYEQMITLSEKTDDMEDREFKNRVLGIIKVLLDAFGIKHPRRLLEIDNKDS